MKIVGESRVAIKSRTSPYLDSEHDEHSQQTRSKITPLLWIELMLEKVAFICREWAFSN